MMRKQIKYLTAVGEALFFGDVSTGRRRIWDGFVIWRQICLSHPISCRAHHV